VLLARLTLGRQPRILAQGGRQDQEGTAMLGEQLGEERGKITARRVLPSDGGGPKVEVSFEASGKIIGSDVTDLGTYWSVVQSNGALYGEGQGVIMTPQGEVIQWIGAGRGHFTAQGGVSFRGAVYY